MDCGCISTALTVAWQPRWSLRKAFSRVSIGLIPIALDFHKWLYQPYEAGCALFKGWDTSRKTFHHQAAYLSTDLTGDRRVDLPDLSFQLSRNFKALKIWMTFKAFGTERLRQEIEADLGKARYLAQVIRASTDFELVNEPELSIVCFRYLGSGSRERRARGPLESGHHPGPGEGWSRVHHRNENSRAPCHPGVLCEPPPEQR